MGIQSPSTLPTQAIGIACLGVVRGYQPPL
jgi:hypothetical protein